MYLYVYIGWHRVCIDIDIDIVFIYLCLFLPQRDGGPEVPLFSLPPLPLCIRVVGWLFGQRCRVLRLIVRLSK